MSEIRCEKCGDRNVAWYQPDWPEYKSWYLMEKHGDCVSREKRHECKRKPRKEKSRVK